VRTIYLITVVALCKRSLDSLDLECTFLFTGIQIGKSIYDKDPTALIVYALSFVQKFPTFMKIVLPSS